MNIINTQKVKEYLSCGNRVMLQSKLCMNKKVMEVLEVLYNREPYPFSTINFIKGSNQPLHSDVIHFHSNPPLWMCSVWIAFEDVDETNGSLSIVSLVTNGIIWSTMN